MTENMLITKKLNKSRPILYIITKTKANIK